MSLSKSQYKYYKFIKKIRSDGSEKNITNILYVFNSS